MVDSEKVIKGLEICYTIGETCENCPYYDLPVEQSCNDTLCMDALELLKEQKQKISVLQKAVEQAQKTDKLLDVFGKNYAKIVRCKDCMYWSKDHDHNCMIKQGWFPVKPDWFCADGERE